MTIDRRGKFSAFLRDLPRGVFGMAFDARRRVVWATTSALPQNAAFREEDRDRAAVVKIDSRTGRIIEILAPSDRDKHFSGDLVVGTAGAVYVSDSTRPAIYLICDGAIEPLIIGAPFVSLQGLALAPGEKTLYAADYSKGIAAIDLSTRDVHFLAVPACHPHSPCSTRPQRRKRRHALRQPDRRHHARCHRRWPLLFQRKCGMERI